MTGAIFLIGRSPGRRGFAVACAVVGLLGCGGDDANLGGNGSDAGAPGSQVGKAGGSNGVPVVESVEMRPAKPTVGRTIGMRATISDPDGDTTFARFVWKSSGGEILGEGRTFETVGLEPGDRLQVVVTASDGQAESAPYVHRFNLAVPSPEVGFIAIDSSQGTQPGVILKAVVESTNERATGYEIVVEWRVAGNVVGREKELDTTSLNPGDVVELRAKLDLGDRKTRPVSARPVALARGGAPQIVSEPMAGIEGGEFRYQIRAKSGAAGAKLNYELLGGPDGMSVDPQMGVVTWRPRDDQRGVFKIEVAAKDQWGSGAAQSFEMTVDGPAPAPASAR